MKIRVWKNFVWGSNGRNEGEDSGISLFFEIFFLFANRRKYNKHYFASFYEFIYNTCVINQ